MYHTVTQIDICDSKSRLTLLLSLSSTFHATVKLLDLQLLLAEVWKSEWNAEMCAML